MKLKITETTKTVKTVDVELPYYYAADFGGDNYDSYYYGKIEAHRTTQITLGKSFGVYTSTAEIEVTLCTPQHKEAWFAADKASTAEAYEAARTHAFAMLSGESDTWGAYN